MYQIVAANEVRITVVRMLGRHYGLVEPRRQYVDEVDVAGELIVLLRCNGAGDEDAQMTNRLVDGVDDGLTIGLHVLDALVEVENPVQRLLGWRDIVRL